MAIANKAPLTFQSSRGDLNWEVRDWVSFAGLVGECVEDFMQQTSTTVGDKYLQFKDNPVAIISCDVAARKARIQPAQMLEVLNTIETRLRSRKTPKIERSQELMRFFDGITLEKPHGDNAIEVPLAIKVEDQETIYSGQGTIPVKFGPQAEFEAKVIFNFKMRRTTKKTK